MQQVSNIFGALETILKKYYKKPGVYKAFKENKKKLQKVIDIIELT